MQVTAVNEAGPGPASDPSNTVNVQCFPARATVLLSDGTRRTMADIQIGDEVQVVDMATGRRSFSPVYTSFHTLPNGMFPYVQLRLAPLNDASPSEPGVCNATDVASMKTLRASANHFVYATKGANPLISAARLVHAGRVTVGDTMWAECPGSEGTEALCPSRVVEVSSVVDVGAYAPHTLAGSIVVDGVLAHSVADMELPGGLLLKEVLHAPDFLYTTVCPRFQYPSTSLYSRAS